MTGMVYTNTMKSLEVRALKQLHHDIGNHMDHRNRMNLIRFISALIVLLFSSQISAQTILEQLKVLSAQHQYEKVYQLASKYRNQYEGNPEFDILYGVAAVDTKHVDEGVFALERVVYTQPRNHLARLELARGYFLQGDDVRARQEFTKVLKVKPPASVVKIVDKFMTAIRIRERQYTTSATAYVDLEMGRDSNVNAGPERNSLGVFENVLSADNFEKTDSYANLSFGGNLNHPVTPHRSMFIRADGSIRNNANETVNNNGLITIQGGTQWQKEKAKYKFSLMGQVYLLDGSTNRNMYGLSFEKTYSSTRARQVTLSATLVDMQHPTSEVYDSTQLTLGASSFAKGKNFSWYGGFNLGLQSAKDSSATAKSGADRTIVGGNIGALYPVNNKSNININLSANLSNYTGIYFGSTSKRKDTFSKVALTYNYLISDKWKFRTGINYSLNDSNVALLTYNRSQLLVGFQRAF